MDELIDFLTSTSSLTSNIYSRILTMSDTLLLIIAYFSILNACYAGLHIHKIASFTTQNTQGVTKTPTTKEYSISVHPLFISLLLVMLSRSYPMIGYASVVYNLST